MTREELFIQIIGEITGRSMPELRRILETFRVVNPGGNWNEVLPPIHAHRLLKYLRSEQEALVRWLERGCLTSGCRVGHA
ncbi:MAG: hypothetical protein OEV64_01665 [Desulfobulbaceae bacterium]|nr:hypothetical protein [Desulfobulbaceae bacterium]